MLRGLCNAGVSVLFGVCAAAADGVMGSQEQGAENYQRHCVTCHGADLDGRGPMAPLLPRRPADLRDLGHSAGRDPERLADRIAGRSEDGSHGTAMPSYQLVLAGTDREVALDDGRMVMIPQPVLNLVAFFAARAAQ